MVIYLISCFKGMNSGSGGHYYSLRTLVDSCEHEYKIVVLGDFFPQALSGVDKVSFIRCARNGYLRKNLLADFNSCEIKIIHAYDYLSGLFGSQLANVANVPLVVTKPGGPPIRAWLPKFKNMIVFHQADYELLCGARFLGAINVALIPNRVSSPAVNLDRRSPFPSDKRALNVIRICRIGSAYRESIFQAINLVNALNSQNISARLAVVGTIQESAVYEEVESAISSCSNAVLFTSSEFTVNASELIQFSDLVVGTGRGAIEAMAAGKLVFFPVRNQCIPCFMTEDNYGVAFHHNFSPRIFEDANVNAYEALEKFVRIAREGRLADCQMYAKNNFKRDHDIKSGLPKIYNLYSDARTENRFASLLRIYVYAFLSCLSGLKRRVLVCKLG